MEKEAAVAGFYSPPGVSGAKVDKFPRLQTLSIKELLEGKQLEYPRLLDLTFKKAPKTRRPPAEQQIPLVGVDEEDGPF